MHELGRILVLYLLSLTGLGVLTFVWAESARRRSQRIEDKMERLLDELGTVTTRLDTVDERLADLTLMVDDASRPAVSDGRAQGD